MQLFFVFLCCLIFLFSEKTGNKRVENGPKVVQKVFGESYSNVLEAINIGVNEYIVLLDKANNATPIRHIRGPVKIYPTPSKEVVPDEQCQQVRKTIEINANNAVWLKQPDSQVIRLDQPQFCVPAVGEKIECHVANMLKESEFCIIITSFGQSVLKMSSLAAQRAFFPPPFQMGDREQLPPAYCLLEQLPPAYSLLEQLPPTYSLLDEAPHCTHIG